MAATARAFDAPQAWIRRWRSRVFRTSPSDGAALLLGHSRIYILPTKRGAAMIGTLAIMLVTSMNYALALGFVATFVLSGLVAAALLNTFRNLAGVGIRPGSAGETFAGGTLPFTLTLSGGARARVAISVEPRGGDSRLIDIDAGHARFGHVRRRREHAGTRSAGSRDARVRLPARAVARLGVCTLPAQAASPIPRPSPGRRALPMGSSGTDASAQGRAEDADLAGLRDYQRGDPMQRVAWKAVARGAGWYTKAFDGAGGGGPVVLDFASLPASLSTEQKLSRLTAWVLACERAARAYALVLPVDANRRSAGARPAPHRPHGACAARTSMNTTSAVPGNARRDAAAIAACRAPCAFGLLRSRRCRSGGWAQCSSSHRFRRFPTFPSGSRCSHWP